MPTRYFYSDFTKAINNATVCVLEGMEVDAGRWQGIPTEGKPDLVTLECLNWACEVPVDRPGTKYPSFTLLNRLANEIEPNREWADEHFEERVGGVPLNPDPSHERWPFWHGQDSDTKDEEGKFTHTYSERFWPKKAGPRKATTTYGIRYEYGNLQDVVNQMVEDPYGRQAYLPIFFPEDTGAVHKGRVPCTLGYHFLRRGDVLHMWYDIRSCDLYRHFRDDLYLAVRLQLWIIGACEAQSRYWATVTPGNLYFNAHSLHLHKGDLHHVKRRSIPGYSRPTGRLGNV